MKITKNQLRRIIREEKEKLSRQRLNETHSAETVKELDSIIVAVDEIANGVYMSDPELANDLQMQVERLANLHDKLERTLKDKAFRKVVDRRPTDADGYTWKSQRVGKLLNILDKDYLKKEIKDYGTLVALLFKGKYSLSDYLLVTTYFLLGFLTKGIF